MLVIAHRGANKEAPENSWTAFEKAIEGGSDRIELDAEMTADGFPVILHDRSLKRLFGLDRRLGDVSFDEFKTLKLPDERPVPTVEEVVKDLLPQIELNIEIKGRNLPLAEKVCRLVEASPYKDKVIISTPWHMVGEYLRLHFPEIKRACLTGYIDGISWPYFSFQAPTLLMDFTGTDIVHPRVQTVDRNFMDQARNRGWTVYPWVTMDAEESDREGLWAHMAFLGIDGLCTNYPRQLKGWLDDARIDETTHKQAFLAERPMADPLHPR